MELYTFEDGDGNVREFTTKDADEARRYARENNLKCIVNKFQFVDSELVEDHTVTAEQEVLGVPITLLTIEHEGKVYGAGACAVTIGTIPIGSVALKAGEERHITNEGEAVDWLVARGLPREAAERLVND